MTTIDTSAKISPEWTPAELVQIADNTMDSDLFCDRIFEQLEAAPALLSKDQIYDFEDRIQKDQMRRAAFAIATIGGKELCERIAKEREFAVLVGGLYSELESVAERYQQLTNIFSALHGRLMIALCSREDMKEVIAEGELSLFN